MTIPYLHNIGWLYTASVNHSWGMLHTFWTFIFPGVQFIITCFVFLILKNLQATNSSDSLKKEKSSLFQIHWSIYHFFSFLRHPIKLSIFGPFLLTSSLLHHRSPLVYIVYILGTLVYILGTFSYPLRNTSSQQPTASVQLFYKHYS